MNFTLAEHFNRYDEDATMYFDEVKKTFEDKILNKNTGLVNKANAIAVLLHRKDKDRFTSLHPLLDLPEIVRGCEILDSARLIKQLNAKKERHNGCCKYDVKLSVAEQLKQNVNGMTFTLSKIKMIKKWVRSLSNEQLEYRAIMFSPDHWKRLADMIHLHPEKDFAVSWFLPSCFGTPAPEDTSVYAYNNLTGDNFADYYTKYKFSYELLRTHLNAGKFHPNSDIIRNMIINREDLKTVLWYWDELVTNKNIIDVLERIKNSAEIDLSYGKIVDLISKTTNPEVLEELIRLGENKLKQYQVNIKQPVAVFGDASYSMEIAIKTSGIITSLLCYICNASLHLFHSEDEYFSNPPRTIKDAVKFSKDVKVMGNTAPAASLWHYYSNKKIVKTIIIITDEEENTSYKGYRFADLYKKYMVEVYPAKLVFVSFSDPNSDGDMAKSLRYILGSNFDNMVKVFKFNVKNPDLNRMDIVLKYLALI